MSRPVASWAAAIALGVALLLAGRELPYVNWRALVPPLDRQPLVLRHDAKGDGRFQAPRSGNRSHRGIDLAGPLESPVRAVRSGRVVDARLHRGLGQFVEIRHDGQLRTIYAHLNERYVKRGDRVAQGEVIGTLGKTGNARHAWITPHVHFEMLRDGEPVDPQTLGLRVVAPEGAGGEVELSEDEDASGGN